MLREREGVDAASRLLAATNPNRVRSLILALLCNFNPAAFHRADAKGYVFWAEQVVELDAINPQVASRLARALDRWRKFWPSRTAARPARPSRASAPRRRTSSAERARSRRQAP